MKLIERKTSIPPAALELALCLALYFDTGRMFSLSKELFTESSSESAII